MWIIFAIGASLFWGLTYVFNEQIYKKISISTFLGLASLFICIVTIAFSYFSGNFSKDLTTLASSRTLILYVGLSMIFLLVAELFIGSSITAKNATLAGLIEISYPIFIALFSFLLFKNSQITSSTIVGGVLIFAGIFIIYYFNR